METSKHLYSRPIYKIENGNWGLSYESSVESLSQFSIDYVGVTSFLSVGQFSKNRTLFNEIKRLPWLSEPLPNGVHKELEVPKHDFKTGSDKQLASILFKKLCNEAREVIKQNPNIYILLTGGLDSRIIGGVYAYLYKNGELKQKPKCLTWGLEDSRDVYYARLIAERLDLEWSHIPLGAETVIENIEKCGEYLGMLHSPEMLHSMLWFKNIPSDAMIIAGSFGDSIGRGEFSSLHLLQLEHKVPKNTYSLLRNEVFKKGAEGLKLDLDYVHNRGGRETLKYMQCEYWMQGYRMRNGLCHALSVINKYADIYQMFTSPEVYGFMWSLHPSRRDDDVYTALLTNYFPELAKIPWARNNKAMVGNFSNTKLRPHYHDYTKWSSGELYDYISKLVDPDWFASTGIFRKDSILEMNDLVLRSKERVGRLNDIWLWLAGFRFYIDMLESKGKTIIYESIEDDGQPDQKKKKGIKEKAILLASKSKRINNKARVLRRRYRDLDLKSKKKEMITKFPPKPYEE